MADWGSAWGCSCTHTLILVVRMKMCCSQHFVILSIIFFLWYCIEKFPCNDNFGHHNVKSRLNTRLRTYVELRIALALYSVSLNCWPVEDNNIHEGPLIFSSYDDFLSKFHEVAIYPPISMKKEYWVGCERLFQPGFKPGSHSRNKKH